MNIENFFKIASFLFIFIFLSFFLIYFLSYDIVSIVNFFGFLVVFVALVIFEIYIRIQHNIDNKFASLNLFVKNEIKSLDEKILEKLSENESLMHIAKNAVEYKILNLKYDIENQLKNIYNNSQTNKDENRYRDNN